MRRERVLYDVYIQGVFQLLYLFFRPLLWAALWSVFCPADVSVGKLFLVSSNQRLSLAALLKPSKCLIKITSDSPNQMRRLVSYVLFRRRK